MNFDEVDSVSASRGEATVNNLEIELLHNWEAVT
jgi:hypothetical protein